MHFIPAAIPISSVLAVLLFGGLAAGLGRALAEDFRYYGPRRIAEAALAYLGCIAFLAAVVGAIAALVHFGVLKLA